MAKCLAETATVTDNIKKIHFRKLHMQNQYKGLVYIGLIAIFYLGAINFSWAANVPSPYLPFPSHIETDTIPVKDNSGDFINDPNKNPFDIVPSNVKETVEYDPQSGKYILSQKIGDEFYRMPTYMTFEEYMQWREKEDRKNYFAKLAGVSVGKNRSDKLSDPMAAIDVSNSIVDRLFGGTEVNIQPQGQVDVTMQSRATRTEPSFNTISGPWQINPIDPNVAIRVSVDGKIGTKMNLGFNYDTQSTFDFDRKIKLEYDTEAFGEDDIIKKIEAGNVSLPLQSNLIQGAQSLFGLKTELQFGHLRITALASQQQSEQKSITIDQGASIQEFELAPDDLDENRHFFLSHYHRDNFEVALENLPQINSAFRIADIEVWISDNRPRTNNFENTTLIAGLTDLGESNFREFNQNENMSYINRLLPAGMTIDPELNVTISDIDGNITKDTLPDNRNNALGQLINTSGDIEDENKVQDILVRDWNMGPGDFATFQARKLSRSDFSVNEQLGFISLNIRLRPDQNLAVAYNYYYSATCLEGGEGEGQPTYAVGKLSVNNTQYSTVSEIPTAGSGLDTTGQEPSKVLFTKLLKSALQPVDKPSYDLMMKNVYPLRASQLDPAEFSFDIFYEDDSDGTFKKFLPEPELRFTPLLNLFNLDRLNKFNDPQADGVFDFVPGVTIIPNTGTVVFPVLEPFGADLTKLVKQELINERGFSEIDAEAVAVRVDTFYSFPALYDSSLTQAKQGLERNKFRMMGFVKSSSSGEINLGPFVPQGSVRVRAGGVQLVEGADYEIDYSLGRLRIINDSYLQQGTPINVTFEDQTVFSLQQKNMMGLRADYALSKKANIGATMLRLSERPFTQKVNIGNDPINNAIYGADFSYSSDAPGITKLVDKLPLYSTNAPSSINFYAEAAYLRPGYNDAIGVTNIDNEKESVVSLDDFEGAINGVLLGGFNSQAWTLASTPTEFDEHSLTNDLTYGANRARLSWYTIDRSARISELDNQNSYTRYIDQKDLFPARDVQLGQSELITFDMSFYPTERGPYNFDKPDGLPPYTAGINKAATDDQQKIVLNAPETRWGGIMRDFQNTDFEAANYEFIEFWMLNPYMDRPDGAQHSKTERGEIVVQLGTISEDILKDGSQIYENGLPDDENAVSGFMNTTYGRTSSVTPFVNGFDQETATIQDVGFDGINDAREKVHYEDYLNTLQTAGYNFPAVFDDPSADNFVDLSSDSNDPRSLLERNKLLSNPEGNAPVGNTGGNFRGNRFPDTEDLNNNRSLDGGIGESYYEYRMPIHFAEDDNSDNAGELDLSSTAAEKYITDVVPNTRLDGTIEKWYRFRIPINIPDDTKDIKGFRSIQFMRMYMTGFESPKTFRLAEFQILRNLWRRNVECVTNEDCKIAFAVDEVGFQENGERSPIPYVKPTGLGREILEERLQTTFAIQLQDERSMSLKFEDMARGCEVSINKLADLDLTLYDKLQLFVHGEVDPQHEALAKKGDLTAYVKIGKDQVDHYYEYEIPITLSDISADSSTIGTVDNVWPIDNVMTIPLDFFTDLKKLRIVEDVTAAGETYAREETVFNGTGGGTVKVRGTPSLGRIKIIEIGVRNASEEINCISGEVWVNELRLLGLNQKGALAGEARMQVKLADLGEINASTSYSGIGWGALDQRLAERQRRELIQYDVATALQLGKFMPESWGVSVPFYAQYSKSVANLQFEPYEGDLTVEEKVQAVEESAPNRDPAGQAAIAAEVEDIKDRSKEKTEIKTFNFTNVKKTSSGSPKPWSPSNVSVSYAFTETTSSNPIIKEDKTTEHNSALDYNYSTKASYIQPFKGIKAKSLKLISEFNFNLIPNSFTFGTDIIRSTNSRTFRIPEDPVFRFDDKRFLWNRDYGLNWDFTKSLKFNFKARAGSIVDELRQVGIAATPEERKWVDENGRDVNEFETLPADSDFIRDSVSDYRFDNLKSLGRTQNYGHNLSLTYNIPIKYLPYMDWITAKADYKASYSWNAGSLQVIDKGLDKSEKAIDDDITIGNTIQNDQNRSINATFSFDKLYSKSKYLKEIDKGKQRSRRSSRSKSKKKTENVDDAKTAAKTKKKDTGPSTIERILVRPLLALRNIKASYREDRSTTLPGFFGSSREAGAHGLIQGYSEPGLSFITGGQPNVKVADRANPDNFLFQNQDWFNQSAQFNGILMQTQRQTADLKIALEPIKDLDIDVDFKKSYSQDYTDQFKKQKDITGSFVQDFAIEAGSYTFTHIGGLNTLFDDNVILFNQFVTERQNLSRALAIEENPDTLSVNVNGFEGYYRGYGPENVDVSIPAFLKTYTGRTYTDASGNLLPKNNLLNNVRQRSFIPSPNWTVKYDGLSKLDMFKDIISSFSIRHAYIGTTTVGSYTSNILFDGGTTISSNGNYQSQFNVAALRVSDQFAPLIGFSLKLKNEMTFEGGFNKSRILNLTQLNLAESINSEFTFGFGYTIKNFRANAGKKKGRKRAKKDQEDEKKDDPLTGRRNRQGKVSSDRGKTLTMNLDISVSDNTENIYNLSQNTDPQSPRGNTNILINPSVDYDVNKNLTMRFFVNYNNRITKISNGVSILDIRGGVTAQLKIN